jgi:hypothetical protein
MNFDAFFALVAVFLLSYALRKFTQKTFQFPSPKGVPFLGNIFGINLYRHASSPPHLSLHPYSPNYFRYTDTFEKWHKQLGDTIECYFMHFKYIDSIDHKIVSQVLHSSDRDDLYVSSPQSSPALPHLPYIYLAPNHANSARQQIEIHTVGYNGTQQCNTTGWTCLEEATAYNLRWLHLSGHIQNATGKA